MVQSGRSWDLSFETENICNSYYKKVVLIHALRYMLRNKKIYYVLRCSETRVGKSANNDVKFYFLDPSMSFYLTDVD